MRLIAVALAALVMAPSIGHAHPPKARYVERAVDRASERTAENFMRAGDAVRVRRAARVAAQRWERIDARVQARLATQETEPEPTSSESESVSDDIWYALAVCESSMRNLPCAPFCGYFQFDPDTWMALGYSLPVQAHSYAMQRQAAQEAVAGSSFAQQFPGCSKKLGLG